MVLLFLLILLFQKALCINTSSILFQEVSEYHEETRKKAEYANEVVSKIYNAFKQWFFTITFCDFTYFENRILKYTENMGDGYPVLLLNGCPDTNRTKTKPRIDKHGQTAYVITFDALSTEVSEYVIQALVRTGVFKPRSAVVFVINVAITMDNYFFYTMKTHFQLLWSRNIANSVVIVSSASLKVYSYNPFNDQVIDITNVENIGRFLSHRYNDLCKHELRLSVFRKVFIYDETSPVDCSSRLTTTIIKELNASCKALSPRDGNTVGDLLDNGTATGVTGDLMDGYTDMELNSRILKNTYYGYIDTTYPLTQDQLCFLVKKATKQSVFTTIMKLISFKIFMIFMFNMIILILTSMLARGIEENLNKQRWSKGDTVMILIKCFIRQTANIKFSGVVSRCMILMVVLYSLIIDCVMDGIVTSAITYPRNKPEINTRSDLQNLNLTLGIHNRHINMFAKSEFTALKNRIEIITDKKIKELIVNRRFEYAILLRKSDAMYISRKPSNMHDGKPVYHTTNDCPLPCFIVYGLRYGSPYLDKLNNILHRLSQSGILEYWSKTEEYKLNKNLYRNEKEIKALSFENLSEIFYVWLSALLLSSFVFIVELFWPHFRQIFIKKHIKNVLLK
ncbi:uncharacterized protein Ir85a [Plodia interpunctella]|uniref:uncharacterized protein Ir85a n=1 Tax=Plodia interpunctella TaxID=58824 RepID=UPI00310125D0